MPNEMQPLSRTHWYCERCQRSGHVDHAPAAGVFEVFVQVIDAHHKAFVCIESDYIRIWQDETESETPHADT